MPRFFFCSVYFIYQRGDEFRPKYKEVSRVRSYLTNAPVLMLTATTTEKIMTSILETLMLKHHAVEVVALVPDRYPSWSLCLCVLENSTEHDLLNIK